MEDSIELSALKMFAMLGLVIALAYLILNKGLGTLLNRRQLGQRIRVKERVMLDSKNALYLVQVDEKLFVLSSSEKGAQIIMSDLPNKDDIREEKNQKSSSFSRLINFPSMR